MVEVMDDIKAGMQEQELTDILLQNRTLVSVLSVAARLNLPNWYVGAGAISQTVWNHKGGLDPDHGIEDYDLVYFIPNMTTEEEAALHRAAREHFDGLNVELVNQANVHLWYKGEFGRDITPYISTEAAIDSWPTTATSIGVRLDADGSLKIYAPFGLADLFNLTVRANKILISEDIFNAKTKKWKAKWSNLNIIPW